MRPSTAHQATGLQRGEGSRPSGNSSNKKLVGTYTRSVHDHEENHAAVSTRTPLPKPLASQNSAKSPVKELKPIVTPTPPKIQPIALRGWREAMMAPTTEKASARTDSVTKS